MTDPRPASTRLPTLGGLSAWSVVVPVVAVAAVLAIEPAGAWLTIVLAVLLGGSIMAAVYHAETVAHYLGEPFGTLVLALAVTVIETSLIVSIMLSEGSGAQTLARDTLIAAIMITINAIVGLCLLVGGGRHHEQSYTQSGVSVSLAMLATLAVLTLVLPNFTVSERGPFYTAEQLIFVSVISLLIYGTFVAAQTIRHRDHFQHDPGAQVHAPHGPVTRSKAAAAGLALVAALIAVVLLAKTLSSSIEALVFALGAPQALVGILIAALVLAPEGFTAVAAARANKVQTSLNLAIGSALATIGLTIPAVAGTALLMGLDLELGLSMRSIVLLALTLLVATLTLGTGRTTIVQGIIHLVIFATYLFITIFP
ncbi:calcium:proton antiporter [Tsuneonella sp. HG222]